MSRECNGPDICPHNKIKYQCRQCAPPGYFCIHYRSKTRCKECKGGSICAHGRIRSSCKACKGGGYVLTATTNLCANNVGGAAYVSTVAFGASAKTAVEVRYASTASRGALVTIWYPDFRNHSASRRYHCRPCRGAGFCRHGKRRYRSTCQLCAKTPDQPISRFKNQRIESDVRTGLPH